MNHIFRLLFSLLADKSKRAKRLSYDCVTPKSLNLHIHAELIMLIPTRSPRLRQIKNRVLCSLLIWVVRPILCSVLYPLLFVCFLRNCKHNITLSLNCQACALNNNLATAVANHEQILSHGSACPCEIRRDF